MKTMYLMLAVVFTVTICGCTQEEQSATTGALLGAGVGAIIGHQSGEAAEGALIGGTAGLIGGYYYGKMQKQQTAEGQVQKYVTCPKCNVTLNLPAEAKAGDDIRCGKCGTQFKLQ